MAGEIVEGINPTRMELLTIKKKRVLAEKGHKLLGEKRDALVVQFFEVIRKRERLRREVMVAFGDAREDLDESMAVMGYDTVKAYSRGIPPVPDPTISHLNIMGVKVPVVSQGSEVEKDTPWAVGTTPYSLNEATKKYEKALSSLLLLAEAEGAMERLAVEIEKTKRRVNALEHIFIPRLKNTEKYINMQLQEREREDFFRRKRIKALMERQDNA
ncbi:MAG: V-type ATP synthase subunit D [Thermoplasmatota archaeon]